MAEGAMKTKVKSSDFRFKPVRGWLGGDLTEMVGGWKTRVFEVRTPPEADLEPFFPISSLTMHVGGNSWGFYDFA